MIYELEFMPSALRQWNKLDKSIKEQFKTKIAKCLKNPKIAKNRLSGYDDVYKIKLKAAGYRLAYQVIDDRLVILVLAVAKRENDKIYKLLDKLELNN